MCPMRLFLVLFSALIACYFAWRNYSKVEAISVCDPDQSEVSASDNMESASSRQMSSKVSSGFWLLFDMASGRYLWRNLRSASTSGEVKTR